MPHIPRQPTPGKMQADTDEQRPSMFGPRLSLLEHDVPVADVADALFGGRVAVNELTGALELQGTASERRVVGQRITG